MILAAIVLLVVVVILGFFAFVAILPLLIAACLVGITKAPYAPNVPKWYSWLTFVAGGACSLSIIVDVFNDNVDVGGKPLAIMGGYAFVSLMILGIYALSHTDEIKQKKQQIKVNAGKKRIENSVRQTRITISGNNVTIDTDKSESKSITSNDDYLKQRFCVLEDNLQILNQTLSFEVFYSKYRIAVREAKAIEQYCDEHDISSAITYAAVAFLEDDVQIFNDFFDRCEAKEVLHNIRHQVELRRYDIPAQSFDYFMRLCMRYNDSTDKQEYVFCSVVFSKGGKTYYYLSENANVCCGDYVRVPVGDDNKIETARVIKVEIVQGKYAPYPVNKLKYIQPI